MILQILSMQRFVHERIEASIARAASPRLDAKEDQHNRHDDCHMGISKWP